MSLDRDSEGAEVLEVGLEVGERRDGEGVRGEVRLDGR